MPEPYTRTFAEAQLYIQLRPCECGEAAFEASTVLSRLDGRRVVRYEGDCACGRRREFSFRLPDLTGRVAGEGDRYGPPGEPSQLLDAVEWAMLSSLLDAAGQAVLGEDATDDELDSAVEMLSAAVDAVRESLKFLPPGAAAVPAAGVWSETGRQALAADPDLLRRDRLEQLLAGRQRVLRSAVQAARAR